MPVIGCNFFQSHLYRNIIQYLTVNHLAAHFGKKAFALVRIFHEEVICDDAAKYGITQIFKALVVICGFFPNRSVGKGSSV